MSVLIGKSIWLLSLELIGLILAVLDFFGLSGRLEALLRRWRDWERDFVPVMRKARTELFPLHKQWKLLLREMADDAVILAAAAMTAWFYGDRARVSALVGAVPHWVWWTAIIWLPAGLAVAHIIIRQIMAPVGAGVSWLLWRTLWLLSRPKAGIVGSLGLVIAGTGFTLSRTSLLDSVS